MMDGVETGQFEISKILKHLPINCPMFFLLVLIFCWNPGFSFWFLFTG